MDCEKRAHKTIFWFMVCYALFLINLFLQDPPLAFALFFAMFGMPEFLLLAIIPFWIALYKFCRWLYCVEKELNRFRSKPVRPWETIVRALFPFLFPLAHFCIFRDQLSLQNETIEENGQQFKELPKWESHVILVCGILIQISLFFCLNDSLVGRITTFVFSAVLIKSYINTIQAITANLSTLNSLPDNDTPSAPPDEEPHCEEQSEEAVTPQENT